MDNRPAWNLCAAGNIVKTRIDENGEIRHGTKAFVGGARVYLQGKYWKKYDKEIRVIGLTRNHRYEAEDVPVECIENVRLQAVYKPAVVEMMDYFEYESLWWHRTGEDKRDIKRFIELWNSMQKSREERPYISLEQLALEEGCSRECRVDYNLWQWNYNCTEDADELQQKLDKMHLVGRVISDFRFISYVYNMSEDELGETIYLMTEAYPKEYREYLYDLENVPDTFPIPMYLEMDEPLLIRFEDGDQFEILTNMEECFNVDMNKLPWNAKSQICQENINGSIFFDVFKGASITEAEVLTNKDDSGNKHIAGVRIAFKGEDQYSLVFVSESHDYMHVSIEEYPGRILNCPFIKVKQSLYKE